MQKYRPQGIFPWGLRLALTYCFFQESPPSLNR